MRRDARTVTCPYCVRVVPVADLLYQCPNAKPDCPEYIHGREGQSGAMCPSCETISSTPICPNDDCRSKMPPRYPDMPAHLFALAGPPSSGKSTFLAMLIHALKTEVGEFIGGVISPADEWTNNRMRAFERLTEEGLMLPRTLPMQQQEGRLQPLIFLLDYGRRPRPPRRRVVRKSVVLVFFDTAGEDQRDVHRIERFLRYLKQATAVFFFLDPLTTPAAAGHLADRTRNQPATVDASEVVRNVTTHLHTAWDQRNPASDRLAVPVALAISKVDELRPDVLEGSPLFQRSEDLAGPADRREMHEFVRGLLHEWRSDLDQYLSLHYEEHGLFAFSSLGAPPTENGHVAPGGLRPYRVTDPQLWLLRKLRVL